MNEVEAMRADLDGMLADMAGAPVCVVVQADGRPCLDPMPVRPPDGLEWCPHCLGRLAERLGELLARMAVAP